MAWPGLAGPGLAWPGLAWPACPVLARLGLASPWPGRRVAPCSLDLANPLEIWGSPIRPQGGREADQTMDGGANQTKAGAPIRPQGRGWAIRPQRAAFQTMEGCQSDHRGEGANSFAMATSPHQLCHCNSATQALTPQLCRISFATTTLPQELCRSFFAPGVVPQQLCYISFAKMAALPQQPLPQGLCHNCSATAGCATAMSQQPLLQLFVLQQLCHISSATTTLPQQPLP